MIARIQQMWFYEGRKQHTDFFKWGNSNLIVKINQQDYF